MRSNLLENMFYIQFENILRFQNELDLGKKPQYRDVSLRTSRKSLVLVVLVALQVVVMLVVLTSGLLTF